ncbi:MAG: hypothetical protein AMXMBFR13_46510 [Phycisphaerae bacterium]
MRRYAVIVEEGPDNYSAYSPDLPGCVATGQTLEQVRAHMRKAIEMHIRGLVEDGESVPEPQCVDAFLETIEV